MVQEHELSLRDRQQMQVNGVLNVNSFGEKEVTLETTMGLLTLKGEGLHITHFDIAVGELGLEGHVRLMEYHDKGVRGGRGRPGFMERFLR